MWKEKYKQEDFYWGIKPHPFIKKCSKLIPKGTILDIGCGEGRNSIFLEKEGFAVEAIDVENEGIKKLKKYIKDNKLKNIKTIVQDITQFDIIKNKYSGIIAICSLDFLKLSDIDKVIKKIKIDLQKKGIVCFLVFSTKDPSYEILKNNLEEVDYNTFFVPQMGCYRHFFTPEELKIFFNDWRIISLKQKEIQDEHDGLEKHTHSLIEFVAQKKR